MNNSAKLRFYVKDIFNILSWSNNSINKLSINNSYDSFKRIIVPGKIIIQSLSYVKYFI